MQPPGRDRADGDFQRLAREVLHAIAARGKLPVVVGGTGFYLKALIDGLFKGPARSEELRERMRKIISRRGTARLHSVLRRVDTTTIMFFLGILQDTVDLAGA